MGRVPEERRGEKVARARERERRRSLRRRGYDDGQVGLYFVTIRAWGWEPILGAVVGGESCPNEGGTSVWRTWEGLPDRFPGIAVDAFGVMPNHVHGIVFLGTDPGGEGRGVGQCRASPAPPENVAPSAAPHGPVNVAPTSPPHGHDNGASSSSPRGSANGPSSSSPDGPATMVGVGLVLPASPTAASPLPTAAFAPPTLGAVVGAFTSLSAIDGNRLLGRAG